MAEVAGLTRLNRILLVDDDPDVRSVLQMALEVIGEYTVCGCASGSEALAQIESFQPQLLILDVMMPDMDGPETLRQLRARGDLERVATVFLTAKAYPHEQERLRGLGVSGVLAKPFDPMTVSEELQRIWSQAHEGRH